MRRNEAHHSGLTDDRQYLWGGGLDANALQAGGERSSAPVLTLPVGQ